MSGDLKALVKPTVVVSLLTLGAQGVSFVAQVVIASLFGAQSDMDTYLAAYAIPQYALVALLSSLTVVFVPLFVDQIANGREDSAWEMASTLMNAGLVGLGALCVAGMLFPDQILRITAPGLTDSARQLAGRVAVITWPTVVATALVILLSGIYQSYSKFVWPALVPIVGGLATLTLTIVLSGPYGVVGLAMATTMGLALQAVLLLPIVWRRGRYRFTLRLRHPAVVRTFCLLAPLIAANLVSKATTIVERFLASWMAAGSISDLAYAYRLWTTMALLTSTGITTVVFPRMATSVARDDIAGLRHTISSSLRFMWLAVAPATAFGIALALPIVTAAFQRGKFDAADAGTVAGLFRVYLLALGSGCLGNITSSSFYVLQEMRIIAILSSVESVAYVVYTALLAQWLGASGIPLGFVILYNSSWVWQILIVRAKTGNYGGRRVIDSFVRTGVAALLGGGAAWGATWLPFNAWLQLIAGGFAGLSVYGTTLLLLRSPEATAIARALVHKYVQWGRARNVTIGR